MPGPRVENHEKLEWCAPLPCAFPRFSSCVSAATSRALADVAGATPFPTLAEPAVNFLTRHAGLCLPGELMPNRRDFLKIGALAAGSALLPVKWTRSALAQIPGGTLPPGDIPKYQMPLVIPPAMPITSVIPGRGGRPTHYYELAVRQFQQQILPTPLPATTVWSYGSVHHPGTFNYPAFTIEARWRAPVRVKWMNQLVDANNHFRPHLLPVDPTLHWANPPGGMTGRDMRPTFDTTPEPYTGPVPMSVHLHGGHSTQESDGHAEAWFLPNANNID